MVSSRPSFLLPSFFLLQVVASAPHIAMVVDQPLALRAGTELFTLIVGPLERGWRPAFTENMTDRLRDGAKGAAAVPGNAGGLIRASSSSSVLVDSPGGPGGTTGTGGSGRGSGCPILMQTGPNVKVTAEVPRSPHPHPHPRSSPPPRWMQVTAEVPRAEVVVHLPSLMAFVATHFR